MRIEHVLGSGNVIRFPIELRVLPTLDLLRELRFDVRNLFAQAEAFGFELPSPELRDLTDAATAEHTSPRISVRMSGRWASF